MSTQTQASAKALNPVLKIFGEYAAVPGTKNSDMAADACCQIQHAMAAVNVVANFLEHIDQETLANALWGAHQMLEMANSLVTRLDVRD